MLEKIVKRFLWFGSICLLVMISVAYFIYRSQNPSIEYPIETLEKESHLCLATYQIYVDNSFVPYLEFEHEVASDQFKSNDVGFSGFAPSSATSWDIKNHSPIVEKELEILDVLKQNMKAANLSLFYGIGYDRVEVNVDSFICASEEITHGAYIYPVALPNSFWSIQDFKGTTQISYEDASHQFFNFMKFQVPNLQEILTFNEFPENNWIETEEKTDATDGSFRVMWGTQDYEDLYLALHALPANIYYREIAGGIVGEIDMFPETVAADVAPSE